MATQPSDFQLELLQWTLELLQWTLVHSEEADRLANLAVCMHPRCAPLVASATGGSVPTLLCRPFLLHAI